MSMNAVPSAPPPGSGEPPSNHELDRRLTVLETRFDTILPTLATKQDLLELRSEMRLMFAEQAREFQMLRTDLFKALNDQLKWTMALIATLFIGISAVNFSMWNILYREAEALTRYTIRAERETARNVPAAPASKPENRADTAD